MCGLSTATLEIFGHFTARLARPATRAPLTSHFSIISALASAVGRPRLALRSSPAIPVALEGEVDEAVDERDVVEARRLPHARVAAGRGEAGGGVDLVQGQGALGLGGRVHARPAGAVHGPLG